MRVMIRSTSSNMLPGITRLFFGMMSSVTS